MDLKSLFLTSRMHSETHAGTRTAHQCNGIKKKRPKEGNLFKLLFREARVVISAKHIFSAPKGEFSSTVELQIGGAAAPEWVWWSRSPAKHALRLENWC
jgi:hypothetical protein